VPAQFAQSSAQYLVNAGIKYIWNFTPTVLKVPEDVQVWNENLMGNFLQFTYDIN
jgi:NADH/NAD ratio-sensing transcriptional regulator Rex